MDHNSRNKTCLHTFSTWRRPGSVSPASLYSLSVLPSMSWSLLGFVSRLFNFSTVEKETGNHHRSLSSYSSPLLPGDWLPCLLNHLDHGSWKLLLPLIYLNAINGHSSSLPVSLPCPQKQLIPPRIHWRSIIIFINGYYYDQIEWSLLSLDRPSFTGWSCVVRIVFDFRSLNTGTLITLQS